MRRGKRIGLTGGIGSGKSTMARLWQAMGAQVLDADAIAKRVTGPCGQAIPALLEVFGPWCLDADGGMNRQWMRHLIFQQPEERRRLESVLHPIIGAEIQRAAAASVASVLVLDIPLLVESGRWRPQLDAVVVVDCERHTQIERVVRRNGWSVEQTERVIDQQALRSDRLKAADTVIFNEGIALSEFEQQGRHLGLHFGLSSGD